MLHWVADNVAWMLLLLGIVAGCLGAAWWNTRKRPLLIAAGAVVALMVLCAVLPLLIVTDSRQLSRNVDDIVDAINAGNLEGVMQLCEDRIQVETAGGTREIGKDEFLKFAQGNMKLYAVKKVIAGPVHVDKLSRPDAEVSFSVRNEEGDKSGWCTMKFHHADGKWRMRHLAVDASFFGRASPALYPHR